MDIQLNFINQSSDANNSNVVIFQKNTHPDFDAIATAWHVIEVASHGVPFHFAYSVDEHFIGAGTGSQMVAQPKTEYNVVNEDGRPVLVIDPNEKVDGNGYVFENLMEFELIDANVYNGGSKIASVPNVLPQQKVAIELEPNTLYIAINSKNAPMNDGDPLSSEFLAESDKHLKISLAGIKENTTLVLKGGGSEPYTCELEKTVEETPAPAE